MKILHAAALLRPPSGIVYQMKVELEAARQLDLDWSVKMFCPSNWMAPSDVLQFAKTVNAEPKDKSSLAKLIDWTRLRAEYHQWLESQEAEVDVFVLRHYVHDPFQLRFLRKCKKPIYLVHHTLETYELRSPGNLSARIRTCLEEFLGNRSIRESEATIGVTREITNYEIERSGQAGRKFIIYPNGISFQGDSPSDHRGEVPEILFVAGYFIDWHGLDKLLDSIERSDSSFVLHLVGDLSLSDMERAKKDPRIVLHGKLPQTEIRSLSERCWIGLSSFALDRKSMEEACTLKVREYLMHGLPVYAGHREVLPDHFAYYRRGEAKIDEIVAYCGQMRDVSRQDVRAASKPYIDKVDLLADLNREIMRNQGAKGAGTALGKPTRSFETNCQQ